MDDRRADKAAPSAGEPESTAKTDDTADAQGTEQASATESALEKAGDRDVAAEIPTASLAAPGTPPAAVAPVPSPLGQSGGQNDAEPDASAEKAVAAAAAQAEAAESLHVASESGEPGRKAEAETGFLDHLDAVASPAGQAPSAHASSASSGAEAPQASSATPHQGAPVPLGAVPMTIGLRSLAGSSHFEIRLDPVDLGRIDVKLDIDRDQGTVTTQVVVDRPETLALLQRDAGSLQQALSQAGLDSGSGISLSLRGDGTPGGQTSGDQRPDGRGADGRNGAPLSDASLAQPITDASSQRMLRGIAGIDIRI